MSAPAVAPAEDPAPGALDGTSEVIPHWVALGSGCSARSDEPGDVVADTFAAPDGTRHGIRFHLDAFSLDSAARPPDASPVFGKECRLRLALAPPDGMRVTRIAAETGIVTSKAVGAELRTQHHLFVGASTLAREDGEWLASDQHDDVLSAVQLSADAQGDLPAMDCAEKRVVGFDYTWVADISAGGSVAVAVAGDRTLALEVEVEPCDP